ncbi:MAG: IS4 family transposase [Cytophagales bacterium]|nr:IS4 family transposase [Cytophagales bacterium]
MKQIKQIRGEERLTRLKTLCWLMVGIYMGQTPHSNKLASHIIGTAKKLSKAKRLRRWLSNPKVRVRAWYRPVAEGLLNQAAQSHQQIRLIVDGTRIGSRHQLLMVALAYRRRALPIAWTWVRQKRGHSSAKQQQALLSYVKELMPPEVSVVLLGDSEFGAVPVLKLLESWQWGYVLRQTSKHTWREPDSAIWHKFGSLGQRGQKAWMPQVIFCQSDPIMLNLAAVWHPNEVRPWLLVTNLDNLALALRLYSRRMWIEEMFGDFKANGFDLEALRLRHFLRLSRFTLAAALLYVWLLAFASKVVKNGQRQLIDRTEARHLSYFRIGWDYLQRCLTNNLSFSFRLLPYF